MGNFDDDSNNEPRYEIGINAVSLKEEDGETPSAEDIAIGNVMYIRIIQSLSTDREKFVAIALDQGFEVAEIAQMLNLSASWVYKVIWGIQNQLGSYHNKKSKI